MLYVIYLYIDITYSVFSFYFIHPYYWQT